LGRQRGEKGDRENLEDNAQSKVPETHFRGWRGRKAFLGDIKNEKGKEKRGHGTFRRKKTEGQPN